MAEHPVATEEQHAHELRALELSRHATVRAAYERIRDKWLAEADPPPGDDMRGCFERAFKDVDSHLPLPPVAL